MAQVLIFITIDIIELVDILYKGCFFLIENRMFFNRICIMNLILQHTSCKERLFVTCQIHANKGTTANKIVTKTVLQFLSVN